MSIKITDLTALTTAADTDVVPVVDIANNTTKKITRKNLLKSSNIENPTVMDANSNEILKVSNVASAINEFTMANAATANGPELQATGGDTNINIELIPKGTGNVLIGGNPFAHGAWSTWTPTLNGVTLGNGTVTGKSVQHGKVGLFWLSFVFGSSSSITGNVSYTLPWTAVSYSGTAGVQPIASVKIFDTSTSNRFNGFSYWITTTTASVKWFQVSGTAISDTDLSSTNPMTWATGDEFFLQGAVQIA